MTALPFFTFPILQELYIKSKYEVQLCVLLKYRDWDRAPFESEDTFISNLCTETDTL